MKQIDVQTLAAKMAANESIEIIDVRETWEHQLVRLESSRHIPMAEISARIEEIPVNKPLICLCHHGMRSMQVAVFLQARGFKDVYNLQGGIDAWSRTVDPSYATY